MRAVILAAGRGSRLRPYTDRRPKCMVEVRGKPLLESTLSALDQAGVREAVIVVGYFGDQIREAYGARFGGVTLRYVENPVYGSTNTLYGLWMARALMDEDILLLEADRLYEPEVLTELVESPHEDIALVAELAPHMTGTVLFAVGDRATSMVLRKDQHPDFDLSEALKTVSVYKLSEEVLEHTLVPALVQWVRTERTDEPYEAVLAQLIAEGTLPLHVHRMGPRPWADIDDAKDLRIAEATFAAVHGEPLDEQEPRSASSGGRY
jgi:NDP-sugar pyrophosphorylase family protein